MMGKEIIASRPGTKYGIRIADTEYSPGKFKVLALTKFLEGNVLSGFIEIPEAEYLKLNGEITVFHYWDDSEEKVLLDELAEDQFENLAKKDVLRNRLKYLHFEIQFTAVLEESTTELQNEYDNLLTEYESLIEA